MVMFEGRPLARLFALNPFVANFGFAAASLPVGRQK